MACHPLRLVVASTLLMLPAALLAAEAPPASSAKPNILLIVADDLGYSDIGAFGGEISTPNLDALATGGAQLSSFYTAPFCSPTRAMLMSGVDNHQAGFGGMAELLTAEQKGRPGYEGYLNDRVVPFPQLLRDAGYHTYMTGKWHLGTTEETSPARRGFDSSFALVQGGASHFDQTGVIVGDPEHPPKAIYREDGQLVNLPERGFYSSQFFARRMVQYIDRNHDDGKPFFAYLAFTAPHWPLQADAETIKKYENRYLAGYDVIREERTQRMKAKGLIPQDAKPYNGNEAWPHWNQLTPEQQKIEARRMAVYAAMVDDMDYYLGEVLSYLKKTGQYDNTLVLFMSDNGADGNSVLDEARTREWVRTKADNRFDNIGHKGSFIEYGPGWAQVGSNPFHLYKAFVYEGGISVPFLASWPQRKLQSGNHRAFAHVTDIAPTILEAAGAQKPGAQYAGRSVIPMQGSSLLPMLTGQSERVHPKDQVTGWELGGRKALRKGDWKIVYANPPWGSGKWELYNLAEDRTELNDLAARYPRKLKELEAEYLRYAERTGTIDIPGLAERKGYSNGREYYEDIK
jgi:arylsulfatase